MVRRDQLTKISGGKGNFMHCDWFMFLDEIISFHMLILGLQSIALGLIAFESTGGIIGGLRSMHRFHCRNGIDAILRSAQRNVFILTDITITWVIQPPAILSRIVLSKICLSPESYQPLPFPVVTTQCSSPPYPPMPGLPG